MADSETLIPPGNQVSHVVSMNVDRGSVISAIVTVNLLFCILMLYLEVILYDLSHLA